MLFSELLRRGNIKWVIMLRGGNKSEKMREKMSIKFWGNQEKFIILRCSNKPYPKKGRKALEQT